MKLTRKVCNSETIIHARYDWTTGVPDYGNVWRKHRAVPRVYPSQPLIRAYFHRVGSKEGLLDYQGRAGSTSIVQWTLRPVIFGVEKSATKSEMDSLKKGPKCPRESLSPVQLPKN